MRAVSLGPSGPIFADVPRHRQAQPIRRIRRGTPRPAPTAVAEPAPAEQHMAFAEPIGEEEREA